MYFSSQVHTMTCRMTLLLMMCVSVQGATLVIGDVHGDLSALERVLVGAGAIHVTPDGAWIWTFGNNTVVQLGDLIDRGPDDAAILKHVERLHAHGHWVQLLGNHEVMNMQGDFRYAVDGNGFETRHQRQDYFKHTFLKHMPVVHVQDGAVFVHAGLSDLRVASLGQDVINARATDCLRGTHTCHEMNHVVWDRTYAHDVLSQHKSLDDVCQDTLIPILNAFQASTLVMGHSPVPMYTKNTDKLVYTCPGADQKRLVFADVGMSQWMLGTTPTALLYDDAHQWHVLKFST